MNYLSGASPGHQGASSTNVDFARTLAHIMQMPDGYREVARLAAVASQQDRSEAERDVAQSVESLLASAEPRANGRAHKYHQPSASSSPPPSNPARSTSSSNSSQPKGSSRAVDQVASLRASSNRSPSQSSSHLRSQVQGSVYRPVGTLETWGQNPGVRSVGLQPFDEASVGHGMSSSSSLASARSLEEQKREEALVNHYAEIVALPSTVSCFVSCCFFLF